MAGKQSQINGKNGGRPKGSTRIPRLADDLTPRQKTAIKNKVYKLAMAGDTNLLKLLTEQIYGKARQSLELSGDEEKPINVNESLSPEERKNISAAITQAFLDNTKA